PPDGLRPIAFIDADGRGRPNAMGVEEDHNLPNDFLLGPRCQHARLAFGPNAVEFEQALGLLLDDVEHRFPEGLHQFAGKVGPDAFDHARAQILLDPLRGARRHDGDGPRLELPPVGAVLHPAPLAVEVLAGSHLGHRPYDRHEIALTRHFDPQHTEAILYAVKGDPLNDSGEPFA